MKINKILIIFIFIILNTITLFSYTEYQGYTIKAIRFEGLKFYTPENLKDNMQSTEGQPFSPYYINKDFKRIYSLGAFKDIKMYVQKAQDNQVVITFKVNEYPKIDEVIFEGVDELSDSDVSDVMRLREDSHYNPAYIPRDRKEIIKLYKEKGFLYTRVSFKMEKSDEPNKVVLKVVLNEGEKILIEQITIYGTKNLDKSEVKKIMENSETTLLGGDQTYSEHKKKSDIQRVLSYARWKGYLFARVVRYDVKIDWVDPEFKDKRGYYIEVEIEEGEKWKMGKITFKGNKLFTSRELRGLMQIKQGDTYDELKFKKSLQAIYDSYRTQGYIYTKITIIETYDRKNNVVSFLFDIFDGDRAHIETIIFRGNTKTKSYVLDRELRIWEGEVFNIARINVSKFLLNRLGYFKKVDMDIRPSSEEGLVDLIFTVEPQRTGMISFGGGYGTLSGFTIFTEVSEKNFLGRGYTISARGEYGQYTKELRLSWSSRYLTRYLPISWGVSAGIRWQRRMTVPYYDRNGDGKPDKLVAKGDGSGDFVLVQSSGRGEGQAAGSHTTNNAYGGSTNYDLQYVSEDEWLNYIDYDKNGDFALSPTTDASTEERYYDEFNIFARFNIGYSFANFFHIGTGYSFTATQLSNVNPYGNADWWNDYNYITDGNDGTSYQTYITVSNLYEELPGAKTTLKNALTTEHWLFTSRVPVSISFNNTDDNFNPTTGLSASATWSFVGLGGDVKYNLLNVETAFYIPLPLNFVWANRVGMAIIFPWFNQEHPLVLEGSKLSFDGINEGRGWQDYIYYDRYRGYGKVVLSSELRWPIPATNKILWWVFFFDGIGINNYPKGGRLPGNLSNEYIFSWGFGLRIQIPMFPIRLYGAQRLEWVNGTLKPASDSLEFVFSIAGYF